MVKRIIIVGASSGIGREVATLYLERGYQVGMAARRYEKLKEMQDKYPQQVHVKAIDVTAHDAAEKLYELVDEMGGMDIYFHCSGIGSQNTALNEEVEQATIATNVTGFTRMVLAAYRYFAAHGGGQIAAISSIAGTKGLGVAPSYSATKRFQNNYMDALAQLARMQGLAIRFTDIRPGFVRTDLLKDGRNYPLLLSPRYAARRIVSAIDKKKRRAIIDWKYVFVVCLWKCIPEWLWERLPIRN